MQEILTPIIVIVAITGLSAYYLFSY